MAKQVLKENCIDSDICRPIAGGRIAFDREAIKAFPTNIVAGAFNFDHRDYFKVEAAAEREAPKVSFT